MLFVVTIEDFSCVATIFGSIRNIVWRVHLLFLLLF